MLMIQVFNSNGLKQMDHVRHDFLGQISQVLEMPGKCMIVLIFPQMEKLQERCSSQIRMQIRIYQVSDIIVQMGKQIRLLEIPLLFDHKKSMNSQSDLLSMP